MVVAESFEAAREAAYRVDVSYDARTPASTFDSAGVTIEEVTKKEKLPQAGDADAAFETAEVKLDAEYATPTQHHNAIELFTTTCVWQDGKLTIYEPSQFVHGLRANAAAKLGIDATHVHAVSPFVGGAFGAKAQFSVRTGLVALAARKLKRPVKLVMTRDRALRRRPIAPRRGTGSSSARNATARS
jgi:xanthine dehydrogenase YagR molybdenum-binding subunit